MVLDVYQFRVSIGTSRTPILFNWETYTLKVYGSYGTKGRCKPTSFQVYISLSTTSFSLSTTSSLLP